MLALIDKSESQGRIQPFGRRSSSRVAARWSLSAAVRQKAVTQGSRAVARDPARPSYQFAVPFQPGGRDVALGCWQPHADLAGRTVSAKCARQRVPLLFSTISGRETAMTKLLVSILGMAVLAVPLAASAEDVPYRLSGRGKSLVRNFTKMIK
jgi:hypothetical protein